MLNSLLIAVACPLVLTAVCFAVRDLARQHQSRTPMHCPAEDISCGQCLLHEACGDRRNTKTGHVACHLD